MAFDKMSNHNLYIAAEDIVDLLGADSNEEEIFNILAENNLKPSSQIYFPEVDLPMHSQMSRKNDLIKIEIFFSYARTLYYVVQADYEWWLQQSYGALSLSHTSEKTCVWDW